MELCLNFLKLGQNILCTKHPPTNLQIFLSKKAWRPKKGIHVSNPLKCLCLSEISPSLRHKTNFENPIFALNETFAA